MGKTGNNNMVINAEKKAEAIYLETFSIVAANADFIEPEEGVDLLLEETLLVSLAVTILTSFLEGIFGELGREFLEKVRQRIFGRGKLIDTEPKFFIDELKKKIETMRIEGGSWLWQKKILNAPCGIWELQKKLVKI